MLAESSNASCSSLKPPSPAPPLQAHSHSLPSFPTPTPCIAQQPHTRRHMRRAAPPACLCSLTPSSSRAALRTCSSSAARASPARCCARSSSWRHTRWGGKRVLWRLQQWLWRLVLPAATHASANCTCSVHRAPAHPRNFSPPTPTRAYPQHPTPTCHSQPQPSTTPTAAFATHHPPARRSSRAA